MFRALRRLCPAKLEGRDRGDLISIITSDIELLEVFYAHTISPIAIAALFTIILCLFIGSFHWALGLLALSAYITVGVIVPLVTFRLSGDDGLRFRTKSSELSAFVLDSLRGLPEAVQYGRGAARLAEMDARTDALSQDEARMKRTAGVSLASANTVILAFDLAMLFASALLYQAGAVKLSGVDVGRINTVNLRDMESFVTQDTHLFHDSIKNNLRIAKLNAADEEIIAACKKASVHDFIMTLPQGYDTPVGELGDTLSGGERQRLGLARTFRHGAPLMLLDEPTSNLDSLNEAAILRALGEERGDKTVILVSHRQSTMRIADKICSVENGRMS